MYATIKVRAKVDFICPETHIEVKKGETKEVPLTSYVEKAITEKKLQEVKSTNLELKAPETIEIVANDN